MKKHKMPRIKLSNGLTDVGTPRRRKYRKYPHEALKKAHDAITSGMSIRKAAATFSIPFATLHDRVTGKVSVDCVSTGRETVLSMEEEKQLADHIQAMSDLGYSYTRTEVTTIATELAVCLGKKTKEEPGFSLQWFYGFLRRRPELSWRRPRSSNSQRPGATSEKTVSKYFSDLDNILTKYNLKCNPQRIYNLDEKKLTDNPTPLSEVTSSPGTTVSVATSHSTTTTVIGSGNAVGAFIPPYFIFQGESMRDELLEGSTPGTAGTVSDSGLSNAEIFQQYLQEHFLKNSVAASTDSPLLVLYDANKSHVSIPLINWARQHHMVLFALPAHSSHVLQPMDLGCLGPFSRIYDNLRETYMSENAASSIDEQAVCQLGCKAYNLSLTPSDLQSSFRECGLYPFNPSVASDMNIAPSVAFKSSETHAESTADVSEEVVEFFEEKSSELEADVEAVKKPFVPAADVSKVVEFFKEKSSVLEADVEAVKKPLEPTADVSEVVEFFKEKSSVLVKKSARTKKRKVLQ